MISFSRNVEDSYLQLQPATCYQRDYGTGRCFSVNFAKFLRTPLLEDTSGWLPLKYTAFFYSFKIFKVVAAKKTFSPMCMLRYNLLRWMFFITCDNWKALFFTTVYRYSAVFSNRHGFAFFETSVLKEAYILS